MNHERLDAVLTWAAYLGLAEATVDAELMALQVERSVKPRSSSMDRRIRHLEFHQIRGDVICDCYEKVLEHRVTQWHYAVKVTGYQLQPACAVGAFDKVFRPKSAGGLGWDGEHGLTILRGKVSCSDCRRAMGMR